MMRVSLACACALWMSMAIGCSSGDDDDSGATPMAGTTAAGSTAAGSTAAGSTAAGSSAAGTTGGAGTTAMPANMPDAMCIGMAGGDNMACSNCGCTPNAMGGCLTELMACQGATDAMSAMLCGAIIDCARMNKCTGAMCLTPCMSQITTASMYMGGAPLMAATAVGDCTSMKCGTVCP